MITEKDVILANMCLRKYNYTIPDETLREMVDVLMRYVSECELQELNRKALDEQGVDEDK